MVKRETTKTLDNKEYELDERFSPEFWKPKKKYNPEILINPYHSFGLGSKIILEKSKSTSNVQYEMGGEASWNHAASVTALYEEDGKMIIEAEKTTKKEEKMKFVNKIIRKINFSNSLNNNIFIDMLSNVFTDKQLEQFLKEKDLEIILFDGLMYLKVNDKAYRL